MALRGTIADFGLADALQLIAGGHRSGSLTIRGPEHDLELRIRGGAVSEVRARGPTAPTLAERLGRAGLVTSAQLRHARAEGGRTGQPAEAVLLAEGLVEPGPLTEQEIRHRWELVLAPFTWRSGTYRFDNGVAEAPDPGAIPLDQVLMRGLRLVEGWTEVRRRIPSATWTVARRIPLPEDEDPFDPFDPVTEASRTGRPGRAPVSDEARALHGRARPGLAVGPLVDRAPMDRYEATCALAELIEAGLLVIAPP